MRVDGNRAGGPGGQAELEQLLAGTKYRALGLLGKGAQGFVIDAEHEALGKPVVVKVLHARNAANGALVERMRVEAQALARLQSEHLVPVTDLGTLGDGRPYFVMEKVAGRTLQAEVRARGPLSPAEAIDVARQVLAALAVVHRAGLVHRDVKPANVFLCDGPRLGARLVKLLDFGVAKVLATPGAVVDAPAPTAQHFAIGTPRFLSPEQACSNPVDARADLYSVGVLLFWMLAGRDPFAHHEALLDVLLAHVSEAPAPISGAAPFAIPPELEQAISTALQKMPEHRFASAGDFDAALAAVPIGDAAARPANRGTIRLERGGTVRMAPAPAGSRGERGTSVGLAPSEGVARSARGRSLVSWLGAVALVAAAVAGLTVGLLFAARVAGLLK